MMISQEQDSEREKKARFRERKQGKIQEKKRKCVHACQRVRGSMAASKTRNKNSGGNKTGLATSAALGRSLGG
jgi:hypothetical protein